MEAIDNVPHLENWWRAHKSEIDALAAPDLETLKATCAERKAAILRDLATPRAAAERPPEPESVPSVPVLPERKRKTKGNGGLTPAPAA